MTKLNTEPKAVAGEGNAPREKRHFYRTAKARISCAHFKKDDYVSVQYEGQYQFGTHWYRVNNLVTYPEHHLSDFCL